MWRFVPYTCHEINQPRPYLMLLLLAVLLGLISARITFTFVALVGAGRGCCGSKRPRQLA